MSSLKLPHLASTLEWAYKEGRLFNAVFIARVAISTADSVLIKNINDSGGYCLPAAAVRKPGNVPFNKLWITSATEASSKIHLGVLSKCWRLRDSHCFCGYALDGKLATADDTMLLALQLWILLYVATARRGTI